MPEDLDMPEHAIYIRFIMKDNLDPAGNSVEANGTSKIDNIFVTGTLNSTGINDMFSSKNICYPNPTTGIINFDVNYELKSLSVYNVVGELIMRNDDIDNNKIDLSNIPKGMYIINLVNMDNESYSEKFILR
ncbi:MAG: T9SS type A sorting domain-containing protein [Bacteroidota bacterium]|nr:T9SS type A sorting domain-containing protein [Bacteroidota bacterium]